MAAVLGGVPVAMAAKLSARIASTEVAIAAVVSDAAYLSSAVIVN